MEDVDNLKFLGRGGCHGCGTSETRVRSREQSTDRFVSDQRVVGGFVSVAPCRAVERSRSAEMTVIIGDTFYGAASESPLRRFFSSMLSMRVMGRVRLSEVLSSSSSSWGSSVSFATTHRASMHEIATT